MWFFILPRNKLCISFESNSNPFVIDLHLIIGFIHNCEKISFWKFPHWNAQYYFRKCSTKFYNILVLKSYQFQNYYVQFNIIGCISNVWGLEACFNELTFFSLNFFILSIFIHFLTSQVWECGLKSKCATFSSFLFFLGGWVGKVSLWGTLRKSFTYLWYNLCTTLDSLRVNLFLWMWSLTLQYQHFATYRGKVPGRVIGLFWLQLRTM